MSALNKIGLITYHAAYNYGSVLQAYATQEAINQLGYKCTVINYRMKSQKDYYSLIRTKYGIKSFVSDVVMTPILKDRIVARKKFEQFISQRFNLTEEFSDPKDFKLITKNFDCIISGSDQIWNKESCELEKVSWNYMDPYLLSGFHGRKISYASSIPGGSPQNINYVCRKIRDYKAISCRERSITEILSSELNKEIQTVADPTFLLNAEEWKKKLSLEKDSEEYILLYSLSGLRMRKYIVDYAVALSKKFGKRVYVICPYSYIGSNTYYKQVSDIGPNEFIYLLYNARLVVTDSYHGTVLSINLNVPFYSINGISPSDSRKTEVLNRMQLTDRNINWNIDKINKMGLNCDFNEANEFIKREKDSSIHYLNNSFLL